MGGVIMGDKKKIWNNIFKNRFWDITRSLYFL